MLPRQLLQIVQHLSDQIGVGVVERGTFGRVHHFQRTDAPNADRRQRHDLIAAREGEAGRLPAGSRALELAPLPRLQHMSIG